MCNVGEALRRRVPNVSLLLGDDLLPAHLQPDATAVAWEQHRLTYAELRAHSQALAASLLQIAPPGARVGTLLANRGEVFVIYFACAYAGMIFVPVNFRMAAAELAIVVDDCDMDVLFTDRDHEAVVAQVAASRPALHSVVLETSTSGEHYDHLLSGDGVTRAPEQTEATHLILYTSGTSGRPKGVMLTHEAILWFALQQAVYLPEFSTSTVTLLTCPTYSTGFIHEQSIPTLAAGGQVATLPTGGWSPHKMAKYIDQHAATHTVLFPTMIEQMLRADQSSPLDLESLRFVLTGGENCPPVLMQQFRERWNHVRLCIGYGLTEGGIISTILDQDIAQHPGSVGRIFGQQSVRIVADDDTIVPTGAVGEVVISSSSSMLGYWNDDTGAGLTTSGWLRTGDLGRFDADGYLFIEGRSKDLIISSGQNIYPAEIENVLVQHPGIAEVAVVGVPDSRWGESVCAFVVANAGHDLEPSAVSEFVQGRIASYKKPRHVVFVDELPRNPAGKVLKRDLRERFLNQADTEHGDASRKSEPVV